MLHVPVIQGSEEWLHLRYGIVTATKVENLITPAKLDPVKGEKRSRFLRKMLAELILKQPLDQATTPAMLHGTDTESKARAAYALEMDLDPEPCGFCINDARTAGASPDNFVGDDGLAEFKCPWEPDIHLGYVLDAQSLVDEYRLQVQAQMWVTGRQWTDLVSYSLAIPRMVRIRVAADPSIHAKMAAAVTAFDADLQLLKERAIEAKLLESDEPWDDRLQRIQHRAGGSQIKDGLELTDADIKAIWEASLRVERPDAS